MLPYVFGFLLRCIQVIKISSLCFHSFASKPISSWVLSAEHTTLEIHSTVHRDINNKLNSHISLFEITLSKQLPINTFVTHNNLVFKKKHKPFRLGSLKQFNTFPMSLKILWHKLALHFTPIVTIVSHSILKHLSSSHIFANTISTPFFISY